MSCCQDASGCTNEPLHGSNFCVTHTGKRTAVSRRDFHPPCTRCGADDHSFVDCRRASAPDLAPLLERIALELEIKNRRVELGVYRANVIYPDSDEIKAKYAAHSLQLGALERALTDAIARRSS